MKKEDVLADFMLRIEHYQERYEPLDEERESDLSFMKIYNTGEKVLVHKHEGHIQSRIVYYLMNIHIVPRTIYLTRHGESLMNLQGRIGGDSDLSERGREYAIALAEYIADQNIQVRYLFDLFEKDTERRERGEREGGERERGREIRVLIDLFNLIMTV